MANTLTSSQIRHEFLNFFKSKQHAIVPSAPIVIKNDPTLLFTNAGMNQFKDYFLGNAEPQNTRVADTQKCLRVSGKHNDLEEVGVDTYHHTMFEMLGNWSFGDYFKKEAIAWSWELLTEVYGLDKDRLYVTIFEGDAKENLPRDTEAYDEWKKVIAEDRILLGNKKDNFWEMGDTGPCGPCSEIHYDCRPDAERQQTPGVALVNNDHPQVIEIWNNVFMQFNRLKDGTLQPLPAQHVDTGMGFERLVRVIQNKTSNYDTDVFTGTIQVIESITGKTYDFGASRQAIAFRVLADHIRAISFTIADGQLPSNTGAGYVIRRILRRAVRYYYSYLDYKQPLLFQLVPVLAQQFDEVFPELIAQKDFVAKVIKEEEDAFLSTLETGLKKINQVVHDVYVKALSDQINNQGYSLRNQDKKGEVDIIIEEQRIGIEVRKVINVLSRISSARNNDLQDIHYVLYSQGLNENSTIISLEKKLNISLREKEYFKIDGKFAFELYDTFGFPIDLTRLIAAENELIIDEIGFLAELQAQKDRSRAAGAVDTEDWIVVAEGESKFVGYELLQVATSILKYRKVKAKGKEAYQLVLAETPFYAESGGQVGDKGVLQIGGVEINIYDTKKENNLFIHFAEQLPDSIALNQSVTAKVYVGLRKATSANHSATHLLHAALRDVLGKHVAQKGSLVNGEQLRFDFSHFAKVTDAEIGAIEAIVNQKIRENIPVVIKEMPIDEAKALGAMALFGEKYGNVVRVVIMDPNYSIELCGGTHVGSSGELGYFKIKHETAVAAGVRRIEAVSGAAAEVYLNEQLQQLAQVKALFNNPKDLLKQADQLLLENKELKKRLESMEAKRLAAIQQQLAATVQTINGTSFIGALPDVSNAEGLKKLALDLQAIADCVVLASAIGDKASVAISIADGLLVEKGLDASAIIKQQIAPLIKGGGGGNKQLATAGGQQIDALPAVIEKVKSLL